ncbi:MAG: hypothetical protein L0H63_12040 [Nitrococcus sp.]|nr:hypothetical protein [Nitrococcus sp.]
MITPPDLIPFDGDWLSYEERIYQVFLDQFVRADVRFRGKSVKAQYRPEYNGKGFSFWHVISEAPDSHNRNDEDRIPDLRRCERIGWIAWAIRAASDPQSGVTWWGNRRGCNRHIVIWAEERDFAVVLAARSSYFLLKTAYAGIKPHRRQSFTRERADFWSKQNG